MAATKPLRLMAEGEKRQIQEKVGEWEERLARMRSASLPLKGETGERYRRILSDLVVKTEEFKIRWQRVRSRLYVVEEEWQGILESLGSVERAYEEVRSEVESLLPSETPEKRAPIKDGVA